MVSHSFPSSSSPLPVSGELVPSIASSPGAGPLPWEATIWGVPVAKARPRFARRGKFVTTYSAQETEEGRMLWEIRVALGDRTPIEGPVCLLLTFGMPIPASASKKARTAMESGAFHHVKKPDLDNLVKFIKDVCNGLVWIDDCQVVEIVARKAYAARPFTQIRVVKQD